MMMGGLNWLLVIWFWRPLYTPVEKFYPVYTVDNEFKLTGDGRSEIWDRAAILTDFRLPWERTVIPQLTEFRALHTQKSLYLLWRVTDRDLVISNRSGGKLTVTSNDRVEIFFKAHGEMNPYYCLEIDPTGKVLDYAARYYREMQFDWSWPEGQIEIAAVGTQSGYAVEVRLSLASLRALGILLDDGTIEAGLFRGDYDRPSPRSSSVRWISWMNPVSEKPDFHVPSAFGRLVLK